MAYLISYHTKNIRECSIGTQFTAYENPKTHSFSSGATRTIKEFLPEGVKCSNSWTKQDEIFSYDINIHIDFTEEEIYKRDFDKAREIALAMKHEMYDEGDATHEMWNGWITTDPYKMAKTAKEQDIFVLGWFKLKDYQRRMNGLDIGIVAEDFNGNRIWCHAKSSWFEKWEKWYPELYK